MLPVDSQPLVSCIMPTYNRRAFVPQAIHYFLRQEYANKELIIVDDGTDAISDLVPTDERIRYFRLNQKITLGAKLNLACEQARGAIIAHWDDDDWYAARRVGYQVEALRHEGTDVCGINKLLYYDLRTGQAYQYIYPADQRVWLLGSSLCYTKDFWTSHHFADIDVGMDAYFVWSAPPQSVTVLPDSTFSVHMIHQHNVSPKQTDGAYWHPYPVEEIQRLVGVDWLFYQPDHSVISNAQPAGASVESRTARPVRNIYACLVHQSRECVIDLVRNLRYHDPASVILLYNGGSNAELLNGHFPFERYGAVVHPSPRPMSWGRLHDFALDCMRFALDNFSFDTLTIVDSDQLALRSGYSHYLGQFLSDKSGIGLLGNSPAVQPANTNVAPVVQALKERALWQPFLRRFSQGEDKFVHWTFWPSTVFTAEAARDLVRLFGSDEQLQDIMRRSQIWATEEVILPTLVSLLGYQIAAHPCSYDYVKYRVSYSPQQINVAFRQPDVFWVHPVARRCDDAVRKQISAHFNHYEKPFASPDGAPVAEANGHQRLLLTTPILAQMKKIEGWLEEAEADLLIAAATSALTTLPAPHAIVEVGSYCGRATTVLGSVARVLCPEAKVYAVDLYDGRVGALDQGIIEKPPTLEKFKRSMEGASLMNIVEIIQRPAVEVHWERPISLLLIDGLHDYASVAQDFFHFAKWVVAGGYIAFHDYAAYFPGVQAFVNELLRSGRYRKVHCVQSLILVQKLSASEASQQERICEALKPPGEVCAPVL